MTRENQNLVKYKEAFHALESTFNGETREPYFEIRKQALSQFMESGFPTTRHEDWRFTNLNPLVKTDFQPVEKLDESRVDKTFIDAALPAGWKGDLLVFLDGWYSPAWSRRVSDEKQIRISSIAEEMKSDPEGVYTELTRGRPLSPNAFSALNQAFMRDGARIIVPDNTIVEHPVLLLFISTSGKDPFVTYPRNLIEIGRNSKADVVEYYISREQNLYLTNVLTEVYLSENVQLSFDKLQNESMSAYHMSTMVINQESYSRFRNVASTFGGKLVRNNIEARLGGEGIDTTLNGLYLGHGNQHIDNFTFIDHQQPHCDSHEVYRGILDDKASGVFSGKIMVRQDAQKTDAKQTNNCLLLSENARIDAKPQLEIYADDVRCTHGATIGQLDEEALFYLQTRGVSRERARNLLIYAFAEEIIEGVVLEPVRDQVEQMLQKRMEEELHFIK